MRLFAIDTSTEYMNIALMDGEDILSKIHKKAPMAHSRLLVPSIEKLLKKNRMKPRDLDGFIISIGPGSFTGLRIAVATVKGLSFSLKKPIVTVPTLDVIAQNAKKFIGVITPVLDARKGKVYACLYRSNGKSIRRISKYLLLPLEDLVVRLKKLKYDIIMLGDGVEKVRTLCHCELLTRSVKSEAIYQLKDVRLLRRRRRHQGLLAMTALRYWHPRPEALARLGIAKFKSREFVKPEDLEPMYLYSRECDIKGR